MWPGHGGVFIAMCPWSVGGVHKVIRTKLSFIYASELSILFTYRVKAH